MEVDHEPGEGAPDGIENTVEPEYEPKGPRPIIKLSNDVINQIAAAEVSSPPSAPSSSALDPFCVLRYAELARLWKLM
jgi:hypothetical protein